MNPLLEECRAQQAVLCREEVGQVQPRAYCSHTLLEEAAVGLV